MFALPLALFLAASGRLSDPAPRWGTKLIVTYDPAAPGAELHAADPLYLTWDLYRSPRSEHGFARLLKWL